MKNLLHGVQKDLDKCFNHAIACRERHSSIILEGVAASWDDVVAAGRMAADRGYKGVVNRIEVPGLLIPDIKKPLINDGFLDNRHYDVLIIGGGIIGCAIARELSKWSVSILLVDKEDDLSMHASSRNDGMVHPGIEPKPGTKKALFNVRGNKMYEQVARELNVPFRRTGSVILFDKKWLRMLFPYFKRRASKNHVEGIRFLSVQEIRDMEPWVTDAVSGGIHIPSTAFISPYKTTVAYAENAVANGAEVSLNTVVLSMEKVHGRIIRVDTNRGRIYPRLVINAAGAYSDKIADMADDQFFTIHPRKGHMAFLDRKKGYLVGSVVAKPDLMTVKSNTKGGGLVRTVDGNILVGPDAVEQPFREDFTTDRVNIDAILAKHLPLVPLLSPSDVIAYCAGVRAPTYEEDFIVEASEYVENLIHAAGIQSPGLASAPAIAEEAEKISVSILSKIIGLKEKPDWNPIRKGIPDLSKMDERERNEAIRRRPEYGQIICRCEEISKGEIIDAIHSPIPVHTVDGIKRRVRSGMGRCQGGFCLPNVMKILSEETNTDLCRITKKGRNSFLLTEETKKQNAVTGNRVSHGEAVSSGENERESCIKRGDGNDEAI